MLEIIFYIVGGMLIYAGLFTYPNEKNYLQNTIENTWLNLSLKKVEISNFLFLSTKATALNLTIFYENFFGKYFFSKKSVKASIILSMWISPIFFLTFYILFLFIFSTESNSLLLFLLSIIAYIWKEKLIVYLIILAMFVVAVTTEEYLSISLFLYFFSVLVFSKKLTISLLERKNKIPYLLLIVPTLYLLLKVTMVEDFEKLSILSYMLLSFSVIFFIILSDVFSIYASRYILYKIINTESQLRITLFYIYNAIISFVLLLIPVLITIFVVFFILISLNHELYQTKNDFMSVFNANYEIPVYSIFAMSLTTLIPLLLYVLLSFLLILHIILWPIILRPIYSLVDIRIFNKRKELVTVGLSVIYTTSYPEKIINIFERITVFL